MAVKFVKKTKGAPFTVRLSPRIRFGLELLGRRHGRTHSAVIEKALEREFEEGLTLSEEELASISNAENNLLNFLWDPDEADRFVSLAQHFPKLLTYEEELLWKAIKEDEKYWSGGRPNLEAIRGDYEELKVEAAQKADSM